MKVHAWTVPWLIGTLILKPWKTDDQYWNDKPSDRFYVYFGKTSNGKFRIGHTRRLKQRLSEHQRKNGMRKFIEIQEYPTRGHAMAAEQRVYREMKKAGLPATLTDKEI